MPETMASLAIVAGFLKSIFATGKGRPNKMKRKLWVIVILEIISSMLTVLIVKAQQQERKAPPTPAASDMSAMQDDKMNARGDHVMGFDHTKTTHHFLLLSDGGAIEVGANSSQDTESRDQIRMHLGHIAKMFAGGNFKAPMLVHGQIPPGVPVMQKLKNDIQYKFEEMEQGARIRISTSSPKALQAIYEFLRFQIEEHKTGDPVKVRQ